MGAVVCAIERERKGKEKETAVCYKFGDSSPPPPLAPRCPSCVQSRALSSRSSRSCARSSLTRADLAPGRRPRRTDAETTQASEVQRRVSRRGRSRFLPPAIRERRPGDARFKGSQSCDAQRSSLSSSSRRSSYRALSSIERAKQRGKVGEIEKNFWKIERRKGVEMRRK